MINLEGTIKRLKPCPFCGSRKVIVLENTNGFYRVTCGNCQATSGTVGISPEYSAYEVLLNNWNSRIPETASDGKPVNVEQGEDLPTYSSTSTCNKNNCTAEAYEKHSLI